MGLRAVMLGRDPYTIDAVAFMKGQHRSPEYPALNPGPGYCVPPTGIMDIIAGERSITADTALHLGTYFGTSRSPGACVR
jgi:hypothetical protein